MKKTITFCGGDSSESIPQKQQIITHRLKPKRKEDFDTKSVSIGDRTGISTNELLSSISPKLNPSSISISSDSRLSTVLFDREQIRVSCLDTFTIPSFSTKFVVNTLNFDQLRRAAIRKKLKNIVQIPSCIQKTKKICAETNCALKQKWKSKLVLKQKDIIEATNLRITVCTHLTKYDQQIQKDVHRSFSCNIVPKTKITLYHASSDKNNILDMLKAVLKMLAEGDPDVGYVQGINLYVGVVVSHIKEIESSFLFVREIMKYGNMRNMYINGFAKLKDLADHFLHRHIKILMNELYEHLIEAGVTRQIFMPFYLSMFGCVIDYTLIPCVIDQFMSYGFLFLDKLMLSMFCYLKEDLLQTDTDEVACKLGSSYIRGEVKEWEDVLNMAHAIQLN